MTSRDWICFQCGSRWATDGNGELIEVALVEWPCLGCDRLLLILQRSAVLRAEMPPDSEPKQELTPAAILARLLSGRTVKIEHDWAKAAAGDME